MSTFYTATKAASKAGFTHLISGNGEKAPLASVTKNMKASPHLKKTGWAFTSLNGVGLCLIYVDHHRLAGYYQLITEDNRHV